MNISAKCRLSAIAAAGALALGLSPAVAEVSFEGQTIELVYNAGAGGATGIVAQLVAQHIGRHLPGEPTVVAKSMPGGGLLRGITAVYNARPDGKTIGWLAWGGATRVLDPEELRVNFGDFGAIGGLGNQWAVHASTKAGGGIETADDFAKLDKVIYGGFTRGASEIRMAATLALLDIDMQFVGGFQGGADTLAAMQRGEIELRNGTVSNYTQTVVPQMIETGESVGLFYWGKPIDGGGEEENPTLASLPTFYDYYVAQRGSPPSGPEYDLVRYLSLAADGLTWILVTPPETPVEIDAAFAEAYLKTMEDPALVEAAVRVLGETPVPVDRAETQRIMDIVQNITPQIKETMRSYMQSLEN